MIGKFVRRFSKLQYHPPSLVLDIDGVIWKNQNPIPKSKEAIHLLKKKNIPFIFLTNSGGNMEHEKAKELSEHLETDILPQQIILSHTPMKELTSKFKKKRVVIVGSRQVGKVAKEYGLENSITIDEYTRQHPSLYPMGKLPPYPKIENEEKVAAVLVFHDPYNFGQDLQVMIDLLRSNGIPGQLSESEQDVELYMSNGDFLYASDFPWPRFGQGLMKHCLQSVFKELTGKDLKIYQYGKPEKIQYEYAEKRVLEISKKLGYDDVSHMYMVGDNPAADIRGANRAGGKFKGVLVRTGVFKGDDNCKIDPAHFVFENLWEFVSHLNLK